MRFKKEKSRSNKSFIEKPRGRMLSEGKLLCAHSAPTQRLASFTFKCNLQESATGAWSKADTVAPSGGNEAQSHNV